MQKHTAIYVRVSSSQQDVASQLPDLEAFVASLAARGERVEWYRDSFTGKTMNRPEWSRIEQAIAAGEVNRVVVWRIDRLGRTASGLTTLFDRFKREAVNFVSLKDGIDLSTPAGCLLANVLASVAQFETEVRAERVAAGLAAKRARGEKWGGSKKGRRITVTVEKERKVIRMLRNNNGLTDVARATGLGRMTVYRIRKAALQDGRLSVECESNAVA